ncbi:hypothetical protein CK203_061797 [Vitis vinifera]|uniref:Retrotransposon gag domain-containing protein n=1 Tax=Vitis vinifera TaxID=29760 RepID=A0A438GB03_VITVI|nr:hypothetical protein CK203_061797 [Vitis vinifera]
MPNWIQDSGGRLVKLDIPHNKELELSLNIMEATPEDQHSHHGPQDNPNEFRSMRHRMHPPRMSAPSCIVPPTEQLVIRPYIVPLLPTFHGMESENPYAHIKEFEDDKAKIWLNSLRPRSIRTWTDLQADFLKKFFPTHRTNGLKRQISNFSAKENEKFYECWERYMEAYKCFPHHGFDTWLLVSYFYDGMSSSMKQLLETMCGGDFMSKNPEEAMDFLSYVAEAGMYTLNEDDDMKAKFAAMTRRLEELELKKMHEVQAVAETPVQGHCPIPNNNAPYGNTYNSSWRNHPNFSWKARAPQYQQPAQPSQQSSSLEQAIVNLSKVVEILLETKKPSMLNSVKELTVAKKSRFPSQPHQNPKGIHEVETHEGESSQGIRNASEILEVLRQVKVNIPLLDMIKQVPTYAKFLKDLCTIKRGLNVNKKAFLTEQRVNLLPYSVYKQLGLGELKPTSITLSLADRSVKIQGDPTVKEANSVPIILGRPFLATSNAIINCRNGLMQLTFGNMTLELNIFYMSKKKITPEEEEGPEEVCDYYPKSAILRI